MAKLVTFKLLFALLLVASIQSNPMFEDEESVIEEIEDEVWPSDSTEKCTQTTKQKAMYGSFGFDPSVAEKPFTDASVIVEWNDMKFSPNSDRPNGGGTFIAYQTKIVGGPGGYYGVQKKRNGGQFLFSIWDYKRSDGKPAEKLTWPMNMDRCKRNCQDCGGNSNKKAGISTGTQCKLPYKAMQIGVKYEVKLQLVEQTRTINTADYGGMPGGHISIGESDRDVTGSVWTVTMKDMKTGVKSEVGTILFEGEGAGMRKLTTFDEMLGCNKCNSIHHKDTRYGPIITDADGTVRKPLKMSGKDKSKASTCKGYMITGFKEDLSITFESGPFVTGSFPPSKKTQIW